MNEPQVWDEKERGLLTLESIQQLHQPDFKYRIQRHCYEPHTPFFGTGVARTYYVISGACTIAMEASEVSRTLTVGTFLSVPRGNYVMSYLERTEIVVVLELPSEVWPINKAQQSIPADASGAAE